MDTMNNAMFTTTISPISNELRLGGSVLPDRFVSGSTPEQMTSTGSNAGSTVHLGYQIATVIVPVAVV